MGWNKFTIGCRCCSDPYNPYGSVNIPGCVCQGAPATVNLTYNPNYSAGSDPGVAYLPGNGPLTYTETRPGYLASSAYFIKGYYSGLWYGPGDTPSYFLIVCDGIQYRLQAGYKSGNIWQAPGAVCTWGVGPPNQVNFCLPFGLYVSQFIPNGPVYYGNFVATG